MTGFRGRVDGVTGFLCSSQQLSLTHPLPSVPHKRFSVPCIRADDAAAVEHNVVDAVVAASEPVNRRHSPV